MLNIQRQAGTIGGDNRVLASVYNMTASTLARGAVVAYYSALDGSAVDGFSVSTPITNQLDLVSGIVADNPTSAPGSTGIATLTCGFIVIYGVTAYASLHTAASQVVPVVGDKLIPVAGQTYLTYAAAGDGRDGLFCCLSTFASVSVTATTNISVFVRAM